MAELIEYVREDGRNAYREWVLKLDKSAGLRVAASVVRMADGNFSLAKAVGAGVSELRLDFGPGYRVYFGRDGDEWVILLGGGSKKRQQDDIEAAKELWDEYKNRKQARAAADEKIHRNPQGATRRR